MQAVLFTVVAVALYLSCDRVLLHVEARLGRRLEHRTLVFFAMLMTSSLLCFALIRHLLEG
jgi:hypothetical protein